MKFVDLNRSRLSLFLPVLLLGVSLSTPLSAQGNSPPLVLPSGEESLWSNVSDSYDAVHRDSTEPVAIERLILPWEKSRAVALALPVGEFGENPELAKVFQDTLAALLPRLEVFAYHHRLDRRLLGDFLVRLESDERISRHMDNLVLESSDAFSIWMRDFGPQFALGADGHLVLLDPSVGDPEASRGLLFDVKTERDPLQQHFRMTEELTNLRGLEGSDRLPGLMSGLIESRWDRRTRLSRPPLFLQGGDFLPVSEDVALISASTLRANGGRAASFREAVSQYYGVEKVAFLENLPGKTIEHLDFIVQPIREGVILLAEPPVGIGDERSYHRLLKRELAQRFSRNEASIRKLVPAAEIVRLPMPPPALDTETQVRHELFLNALQVFVTRERIAMRVDLQGAMSDWASFSINPRIESKLAEVTGADWKTAVGQKRVIEFYLGSSFEKLLERHVEAQVSYRSYVNSLYVNAGEGNELVLVPRFKPLNEKEAELFPVLERQVEEAYALTCPDAEFVWIDCTALTDFMGMVHCYSLTIPAL